MIHMLTVSYICADFVEMTPQEFEKDDDSNGHIDYIVATAVSCPGICPYP